MLRLNNLKSPAGATKKTKRIGRGQGSGQGTQAGKGHKGQKARTGGGVRLGFEGGQMPLYMRLPKRGFSNAPFKKEYAIINLGQLAEKYSEGDEVSRETLLAKGLLSGRNKSLPLKLLAKGEITFGLVIKGFAKVSKSAQVQIEKLNGKVELTEDK